jgi:methylenetetrahydrofolate dehydrogenase (NADP+) / methenyltetrahydrofolate cyclohydrolase
MEPWRYCTQGISVALRVTPRGGRDDIEGVERLANGRMVVKVRVRATAEGGEANRAVAEFLAKALGMAKARVRILSGTTSRLKQVAVDGDPRQLGEALRQLTTAKPDQQANKQGNEMTARIIDGKIIAAELRARVADEVARVRREHQLTPGLAVVLVGSDPASEVYVRSKHKQTQAAGMASFEHILPADVAQSDLLALIGELNRDPAVHGILVQLPLPKSLDTETIINAIDPAKDVDGLHPNNAGRLAGGFAALSPCTPLGCIILTKSVHASLEGMNAIVIGRSNLVGRPLVQLLLNENATVTIAHSRSRDLAQLCARADLVYAAVGKPEMVRGDWIKPGATVIDVGINRLPAADGKTRLVGDVAFDEALNVAGAITPVPGGVGQMTVACLLVNTLRAACAIKGLPKPAV